MKPAPATRGSPHICLLTGNPLSSNPRALKEADALHAAGMRVTVLGAWMDAQAAQSDKTLLGDRQWTFVPVVDAASAGGWPRTRTGIARRFARATGLHTHWQLGYAGPELLAAAGRLDADLHIAHSEQALWAAQALARRGRRIAVDFEDWFSQDAPAQALGVTYLASLESAVARSACYLSCPSQAMSDALAAKFGATCVNVPNAFAWSERDARDGEYRDRKGAGAPSLHWYSQTIGPGRGLDDLVAALAHMPADFEVHLRGRSQPDFVDALYARVPQAWRSRFFIHPPVPAAQLLSRISEHDIGFAGEQPTCASRDLTVTNKLMHYLLCGLAVVASDTRGQQEVARRAGEGVCLYPAGDAVALARTLSALVRDPDRLARARAASLAAARDYYCWERHAPALVGAVEAALSH